MQHFNGGLGVQIEMFAQVDFGKAASSQMTDEAVVTKLLIYAVCHTHAPFKGQRFHQGILLIYER
ncbi:MAG: hypothetical protein E6I32_00195 [Chloroflexi bacterium]|nr:MAG: hypothetical protein E6I32_00195 [Chloroflexota bacterium]